MASAADSRNPRDSSCGVVAALPTVKSPFSSTTNVSVIVPPASIPSTRGFRATALPPLRVAPRGDHGVAYATARPKRQLPRRRKKCQGEIVEEALPPGRTSLSMSPRSRHAKHFFERGGSLANLGKPTFAKRHHPC